jgi:hypothetical protein
MIHMENIKYRTRCLDYYLNELTYECDIGIKLNYKHVILLLLTSCCIVFVRENS